MLATKHWVDAGKLQMGDAVRKEDGTVGDVENITVAHHSQVMYNLTVAQAHTFFVGQGQWLVHNAKPCDVSLQSLTGVVADSAEKGFHINTDIPGAELGLRPGENGSILIRSAGDVKVNAGDYIKDVTTLLGKQQEKVLTQLRGIISSNPAGSRVVNEARQLIEIITGGNYTVRTQ